MNSLSSPLVGEAFVAHVGVLERASPLVVQVGDVRRREQRPVAAFDHALHEQVGNPVRRVHVVRAAAVVAGVLAQFQEFLDVEVPGLEIGADGALALAALVDGHGGVVDDLEERHDALRLAVGALDVRAHRADIGPVVAEAAGELGQQRVLLDRLVDAVEVVRHRREVARRQLRAVRARVEQRRRRAHEVERREHVVELDRARLALDLVQREPHRDAHEEALRQLEAPAADVLVDEEVAVVERLQPEVAELQVALGLQRRAERLHVVLLQRLVQEADLDAVPHELREVLGVSGRHVVLRGFLAEGLVAQRVEEQAGRDEAVRRVLLDQRARGQHHAFAHFLHRHAVVEVLQRCLEDALRVDAGEAVAGLPDETAQSLEVEGLRHAVVEHRDRHALRFAPLLRFLLCPLLRSALAVEHVGARDFMLAAAHQRELDLILDFLDVDRAAFRLALHQRVDDGIGDLHDFVAHARARRAVAAVDREEGLGHGDGDLRRLEADHRPVAANHLVLRKSLVGRGHRASGFAGQAVASGLGRRGGGSARELHEMVSCRILVVVIAISGFSLVRAVSCKARRAAGFGTARLDSPSGHRPWLA